MKRRGPENVHHLSDGGSSSSIFGSRGCRANRWARPLLAALAGGCCCYPALQPADFRRQVPVRGVAQKGVDTPLVLDRADCRGGNTQPDGAEDIRKDRGLLQVRQVAPLRLVIGMADIVPDLDALPGDCASPRHGAPQPNPNSQRLTAGFAAASTQCRRSSSSASAAGPRSTTLAWTMAEARFCRNDSV